MGIGSGISGSVGIATETTVGTPVAVNRFIEFDSESLTMKKHVAQGAGLRQGALFKRGSRRVLTGREAGGALNFEATTNGFGVWLQHMLGSYSTTATSIGGGLFRQIHNPGQLQGHSFTTQILRPDTSGVFTQEAYTYPGCKISDWELSCAAGGQLKTKVTVDALDEATPSNAFAATTLSALVTAGAASITTLASIPAGSYITIDSGVNTEVVQTGTPSGAGPYTIPIVTTGGVKLAHAAGVYVGSATGVNYGTAAQLQTASYNATTGMFGFNQAQLIAGGSVSTAGGLFTVTGGQPLGVVKSFTFAGKNSIASGRWAAGSQTRAEQIDNGWRELTAEIEIDYSGRAFYDAYASDAPLALQTTVTTPSGAVLQLSAPAGFQEDGATPNVAGPDVLTQKLKFDLLDDGVNGAFQAVYTSSDSAV